MLTFDQAQRKYGKLLAASKAKKILGINDSQAMRRAVESGRLNGLFLTVGEDIIDPPYYNQKYFFIEDRLNDSDAPRFITLRALSKKFEIPYGTISAWSMQGLLDEGKISKYFYDERWFSKHYKKIKDSRKETTSYSYVKKPIDFIKGKSPDVYSIIMKYIDVRINGKGIMVSGKVKYKKKMIKPEKNAEPLLNQLAIVLYKIICGRCGISEEYWCLSRNGTRYPDITKSDEWAKFEPDRFKFWDVNSRDIDNVTNKLADDTAHNYIQKTLLPFLYFVLNEMKQQKQQLRIERLNGEKSKESEWSQLLEKIEIFEDGIETVIFNAPVKKSRSNGYSDVFEKKGIRLKREHISLMIRNISKSNIRDVLKVKAIIVFSYFTGIRNDELANLKFKNIFLDSRGLPKRFMINPLNKTIEKTDREDGFGKYKITYSKGDYGPSPSWGNYLAPLVTTVLTDYLKMLYKNNPDIVYTPDSYLFPSDEKYPLFAYHPSSIGKIVSLNRKELFDFLPKKTANKITYYDCRRTVANWIVHETNLEDEYIKKLLVRAGQLHIRHDMKQTQSPLILSTYADDPVHEYEYFYIMNEALGFPIEINALHQWEIERGLRVGEAKSDIKKLEIKTIDFNNNSSEQFESMDTTNEEIKQLENELKEISLGYKKSFLRKYGISREQWLSGEPMLTRERKIKKLILKMSEVKGNIS